jgi:hypothetical protein
MYNPRFLNLVTSWRLAVTFRHPSLNPPEKKAHFIGGWVGLEAGLDYAE